MIINHAMRRSDRQLEKNDAEDILRLGEYGFLSTISEDETPYVTPVNYVFCDGTIYIHCATLGHKLVNIAHNSAVCFSVVAHATVLPQRITTAFKSVVAFGTAEVLLDDDVIEPLMEITKKYCHDFLEEGEAASEKYRGNVAVIKITTSRITGKANT